VGALTDSDALLVVRLQAGDESALAAAYDQHAGLVYGLARRVTRDEQLASDITVPLAPQAQVTEARAAEPDVTIIADPVGLCQVAIRRLRPQQLDAVIDGDHALGELVLGGLDALARD
jgi:hypothetical protein